MKPAKRTNHHHPRHKSRRRFLVDVGLGLGAASLAGACSSEKSEAPQSSNAAASGATAGEGPEVKDLRLGIIALTDNSPIVIAHEKGLFKKYGLTTTIVKGASWAAIRDSLSTGDLHGTH